MKEVEITPKQFKRRNLISFSLFFVFILGVFLSLKWIRRAPEENGTRKPLRTVLSFNERFFGSVFNSDRLSKTFPQEAAVKKPRANGNYGLLTPVDTANWHLDVIRGEKDTLHITLAELMKLPKTDVVFDFKCIEGWSQVTHWGGVKFADFVQHYQLGKQATLNYTGISTPDKKYYVGIDMKSALHPQTILCYEMNNVPLPLTQGYPLRLIIPVKYGVKHIKRIGEIKFSNERPPDYWHQKGYDYYTGL
jgi:DMSO/TMAO reductase YedYZ molybdopterin-dependent catalytic subunit